MNIITLVLFVLLLGIIICLHEFGHLIAAKLFHVYCFEYSFGMGPALFQKKTKETVYSIRAIPVGGYVSMAGEQDGDAAYPDVVVPEGRRLTDQKPWKKIIIMLAGVTMNFLLCWFILSMILLYSGGYVQSPSSVIDSVVEDSPAERAGFVSGDEVTQIITADGIKTSVDTFDDIQYALLEISGEEVEFVVQRGEESVSLFVTPEYSEERETYMIGIVGGTSSIVTINFLNCWKYGLEYMIKIAGLMLVAIRRIFTPSGVAQLSGPVGIYQATEQAASQGALTYFFLLAQLSLNVGIFNLLPLPVLDGGQVVITLCEAIVRRPLNEKVKVGISVACWVLLISLMLFVTWNDISKLIFN